MLKKKPQTCHSASCKHTICSCSATATVRKASERLEERSPSLHVILSSCVLIAREVPWFLPRLSYWQKLANSAQAICTAAWTDSSQWKETEATPRLSRGPDVPAERINCSASPALKSQASFIPGVSLPRLSLVTGKWRRQFYHSDCHSRTWTLQLPGKEQKFE